MSLNAILAGMGSPIEDAARQARSFSDLQTLSDKQVASERARIQYMRNEEARRRQMEAVAGPEDLAGGTPGQMVDMPTAPVAAPTFAGTPVPDIQRAQYIARNVTPAVAPNQSNAESARLARYAPPAPRPGDPIVGSDWQPGTGQFVALRGPAGEKQRLDYLRGLNPDVATGGNESMAEAQRLNANQVPAAAPTAAAPVSAPTATTGARTKRGESYATAKTPYDAVISKAATDAGLDPEVFKRLIGSESSFRKDAVSPRGESFGLGIAQIASLHGLSREQMLDPNVALPFAAKLFAQYLKEADGDYSEALMRYKGASSAKGREAMRGPIEDVLSGTRYIGGQAPQPAAAAPTAGMPTQAAAPAQAPAAPDMAFSPEQVTRIAAAAQQDLRIKQLQLQEINNQLSYAPDLATATKLREQANQIRFGAYQAQLVNATAQAVGGDEQAMAQLANAARVQYAQTNQGFVAVAMGQDGQYRATTPPMSREQFINTLYSEATGAAQKARDTQAAAQAKTSGEIAVERAKTEGAIMKAQADAQGAIQKAIAEQRLTQDDIQNISRDPMGGPAMVYTKRGVFSVQPGQDLGGGMTSEPELVPMRGLAG